MSFTATLKVRFGDIDHAGVAYYPNLYHYLHIAFEEFFEQRAGKDYSRVLEEDRIGFPTAHVESDFRKPVKYGDTLEITLTVERVGKSSVEMLFTVTRPGEKEPCMLSRQTVVAVDMGTFSPTPLPEIYRRLFLAIKPTA